MQRNWNNTKKKPKTYCESFHWLYQIRCFHTLLSSMSFSIVILYLAWNAFCLSAIRCCFAASIVSEKIKKNLVIVNFESNEFISVVNDKFEIGE